MEVTPAHRPQGPAPAPACRPQGSAPACRLQGTRKGHSCIYHEQVL